MCRNVAAIKCFSRPFQSGFASTKYLIFYLKVRTVSY